MLQPKRVSSENLDFERVLTELDTNQSRFVSPENDTFLDTFTYKTGETTVNKTLSLVVPVSVAKSLIRYKFSTTLGKICFGIAFHSDSDGLGYMNNHTSNIGDVPPASHDVIDISAGKDYSILSSDWVDSDVIAIAGSFNIPCTGTVAFNWDNTDHSMFTSKKLSCEIEVIESRYVGSDEMKCKKAYEVFSLAAAEKPKLLAALDTFSWKVSQTECEIMAITQEIEALEKKILSTKIEIENVQPEIARQDKLVTFLNERARGITLRLLEKRTLEIVFSYIGDSLLSSVCKYWQCIIRQSKKPATERFLGPLPVHTPPRRIHKTSAPSPTLSPSGSTEIYRRLEETSEVGSFVNNYIGNLSTESAVPSVEEVSSSTSSVIGDELPAEENIQFKGQESSILEPDTEGLAITIQETVEIESEIHVAESLADAEKSEIQATPQDSSQESSPSTLTHLSSSTVTVEARSESSQAEGENEIEGSLPVKVEEEVVAEVYEGKIKDSLSQVLDETAVLEVSTNAISTNEAGVVHLADNDMMLSKYSSEDIQLQELRGRVFDLRGSRGNNDPGTAAAIVALGCHLRDLKQSEEAEKLLAEAIELNTQCQGAAHEDTIAAMSELALLYQGLQLFEEQEELLQLILRIRRATITDRTHPDLLSAISNLGLLLHSMNRLDEAEILYREGLDAMTERLGSDHPGTLVSSNNLAMLLKDKGELAEAEALLRDVITASHQRLGADHPSCINYTGNLGLVLLLHKDDSELADEGEMIIRDTLNFLKEHEYSDTHPWIIKFTSALSKLEG